MSVSIRIDNDVYYMAKSVADIERRSVPAQIEYWAMLGKAILDNPEVSASFVKDILIKSKYADRKLNKETLESFEMTANGEGLTICEDKDDFLRKCGIK